MCRGGLEPPLMSNRRGSARPDFSNNNKWRVCRGESVSQWVRGCVEGVKWSLFALQTGYWSPITHHSSTIIGHCFLVIDYWLQVINYLVAPSTVQRRYNHPRLPPPTAPAIALDTHDHNQNYHLQ